jgi:hypothetical protein
VIDFIGFVLDAGGKGWSGWFSGRQEHTDRLPDPSPARSYRVNLSMSLGLLSATGRLLQTSDCNPAQLELQLHVA